MDIRNTSERKVKSYSFPKDQFWKDKKVLITGHTGFKGSWLSLWLINLGAQVMGYSLEPNQEISLFTQIGLQNKCISHIEDIRDKTTLKRIVNSFSPDVVFHLAAQPLVGMSYEFPEMTWSTNVMGTIYLLDVLRGLKNKCVAILITTDKVYQNKEWEYAYRENDPLGGHDPYSSSKAAAEIAISSWRASFCGQLDHQTSFLSIASARAGNVIGGGDWQQTRIIPDIVEALRKGEEVVVRNPSSTRPWQHVLEPLSGYIKLAKLLSINHKDIELASSYNFGPGLNSNQKVITLVEKCLSIWNGDFIVSKDLNKFHEANLLNLSIEKAFHKLNWEPCWDFDIAVNRTISWYKDVLTNNKSPLEACIDDLMKYQNKLLSKP